ncbi:MAG: hypothetical protein ACYDC1_02140 [Limisphaerales bacterium]
MIQLRSDCLVFRTSDGDVPCSAEYVAVELIGESVSLIDPIVVHEAAQGVLHYFRDELGRDHVTVGEFSEALAKVLRGFGVKVQAAESVLGGEVEVPIPVPEGDLQRLAADAGSGFELGFFFRLREELRAHVRSQPRLVRFTGLRPCVKRLVGVKRWSPRCEDLSDRIVEYLRGCLSELKPGPTCALIVL